MLIATMYDIVRLYIQPGLFFSMFVILYSIVGMEMDLILNVANFCELQKLTCTVHPAGLPFQLTNQPGVARRG